MNQPMMDGYARIVRKMCDILELADEASRLNGFGIEVIGRCNASCEFCSIGLINRKFREGEDTQDNLTHTNLFTEEKVTRSSSKMSFELIDKIFQLHNPSSIIFTGLSEPFLAPDRVFYIVDKLKESNKKHGIAAYTNGSVIQEEHMIKILENRSWNSLHISLNAVSNETRIDVMGLPIDVSENNLIRFMELRKEMGREDSFHVGCVMMLTNKNRKEENEFRNKWKKYFAGKKNCSPPGMFFTTNWNGSVSTPWLRTSNQGYCSQFDSTSPTISSEGEIYLCCYSTKYTFGNILDLKATKAWKERKNIFNIKPNTAPPSNLCGSCTGGSKNQVWA